MGGPRKNLAVRGRIGHFVATEPRRLSEILTGHFRLSTDSAQEIIRLGAVYLFKRRLLSDEMIPKGAYLRVHSSPRRFPIAGIDWRRCVFAETSEYLIAVKPSGVPTHASLDNIEENCLEQLRRQTGRALLVTQRLDVGTSGLIVFAKTKSFQARFNDWLAKRQVKKIYSAQVEMPVKIGRLRHWMEKSERSPKRLSDLERPNHEECLLDILSCEPTSDGQYEVRCELITGRTHQIRAQLAKVGAPVVGDRMYGSKLPSLIAGTESFALACIEMQFGKERFVLSEGN